MSSGMVDPQILVWLFTQWMHLNVMAQLSQLALAQVPPLFQLAVLAQQEPDLREGVKVDGSEMRLAIATNGHVLFFSAMALSEDWNWVGELPPPFHMTPAQMQRAQEGKKLLDLGLNDQLRWMIQTAYSAAQVAVFSRVKEGSITVHEGLFDEHKRIGAIKSSEGTLHEFTETFLSLAMFTQFVDSNMHAEADERVWPEWRQHPTEGFFYMRLFATKGRVAKAIDHFAIQPNKLWTWVEAFDAKPRIPVTTGEVMVTHQTINESMAFLGSVQEKLTYLINVRTGVELAQRQQNGTAPKGLVFPKS